MGSSILSEVERHLDSQDGALHCLSLFSRLVTAPSAHAPAQRAGAQRLRALAQSGHDRRKPIGRNDPKPPSGGLRSRGSSARCAYTPRFGYREVMEPPSEEVPEFPDHWALIFSPFASRPYFSYSSCTNRVRSISELRASWLLRSPARCGIFKLILGQPAKVRTVGPHHENLTSRLAVVRMQHHLIREAGTCARERDPLAVVGPREMSIITRGLGESLQICPVRPDGVNLDRKSVV